MAKKRSRFSLKEDRQLIQVAATSATLEEAAAIFRTSVNTIENKCKRLGIPLRRRGRKRSTQEWTEAEVHQLRMLAKRKVRAGHADLFCDRSVGRLRVRGNRLRRSNARLHRHISDAATTRGIGKRPAVLASPGCAAPTYNSWR